MVTNKAASASDVDVTFIVEGAVIEILDGFGIAHIRSDSGATYGVTRQVAGAEFDQLVEGQRVRLLTLHKFNRVLSIARL